MTAAPFDRIALIVLDGVGVGALPDADRYGDAGANTLSHVAEAVGGLSLPNLEKMGLGNICPARGVDPVAEPAAAWGKMAESSPGKDTTTGHWELAGLPTVESFAAYPDGFPDDIVALFRERTGRDLLGNVAASGTDIIRDLGEEHVRTGKPIVYTSIDSVFQIAAHEDIISPAELYDICRTMREALDPYRIGRIIARPFVGTNAGNFSRTHRRHDFSMPPPAETVLDRLTVAGIPVSGVGKISDIFAGRGVSSSVSIVDNGDGMQKAAEVLGSIDRGVVFVNLVDFDMLYGHRKDAAGFAEALSAFDLWLPGFQDAMEDRDLLILTADHGCDPTTPGTDHTREYVPVLSWHRNMASGPALGTRDSFSDVAATLAEAFGLRWPVGRSFFGSL